MTERSIHVSLPGDGERMTVTITVEGCACRMEDFEMAVIKLAKEFKQRKPDIRVRSISKPCGCTD